MKTYLCLSLLIVSFSQNRIEKLTRLYEHYESTCNNDTESALTYISKAHQIALEIEHNDWLAKTNYGLGYCYYLKREDSLAFLYIKQGIKYAEKSGNLNILSKGYAQIGQIYSLQNNYVKAFESLFKSLQISEKDKTLNDNTVLTFTYIGDVLVTQKDTVKALSYYHKAKALGEKTSSKYLDRAYSSLGLFYMGDKKDSSLFFLRKSVDLYKQNNHTYGEVHSRINIAVTILNFKSYKDYPEALKQLKNAKNLAEHLKNIDLIFFSNYYIGVYYETAEKNVLDAKSYYEGTLKLLKKGYKSEYTVQLYKSLSRVARKSGDYKAAYEYQVKSQTLQDSIFSVEKNKQFHEIQTKFDVEQKNSKIQLLNKENEIQSKQKLWIFISASVLVLFFVIIAYVYKKEAKSQKIIRKKDLLLFEKERETAEQQKKLSEVKYLINGQNKERLRISKELHDGIGSSVAAIRMNLSSLNQSEVKNHRLEQQITQLDDVSKELRIISHALNIGINSDKSLLELINDLIKIHRFDRKFEMHMNIFPKDCLNDLDDFLKINLYRIFQEAFANISKHSQATKVEISCTLHEDELTIMIEDDGIGFENFNHEGIGIKNIKDRIQDLEGKLSIDSKKNHGTTIFIHLPKLQKK